MTYVPATRSITDWQGEAFEPGRSIAHESASSPRQSWGWHVLIVDDDPSMRDMLADYLVTQNIRVSIAADRRGMEHVLAAGRIDLAILDLKLGHDSGFEILRSLRASTDLPIIVLTGHHRDDVDRIVGLELGADDYLTKPVSPRELLAHIRAVLRRSEQRTQRPESKGIRYRFAGWELGMSRRRLTSPTGAAVPLTKGEFALMAAFVQAPQRILSREHLLRASRVHDNEVFDRSIDVQILRLRRKIEANPAAPVLIRTERGVGYEFTPAVETG